MMSARKLIIKSVEPDRSTLAGLIRYHSADWALSQLEKQLDARGVVVDFKPISAREMHSFQNQHSIPVIFDVSISKMANYPPRQISHYTTETNILLSDFYEGTNRGFDRRLCEPADRARAALRSNTVTFGHTGCDLPKFEAWWFSMCRVIKETYGSANAYLEWLDQQAWQHDLIIPCRRPRDYRSQFFLEAYHRGLLDGALWSYGGCRHSEPGHFVLYDQISDQLGLPRCLPGYDGNLEVAYLDVLEWIAASKINVVLETYVEPTDPVMFTEKIYKAMATGSYTVAYLWPGGHEEFAQLGFQLLDSATTAKEAVDAAERALENLPEERNWHNVELFLNEQVLVDQLVHSLSSISDSLIARGLQ